MPYRIFRPFEGVVPVSGRGDVLDANAAANRGFDGLYGWMSKAEALWKAHSGSRDMTLVGRWNYHNELGAQFPIAPLRVVYAASGTLPAACVLRESSAVVEHKLYWMKADSEGEAGYLAAILNSETARARAAQYQSRGQWGARDFDKVMFNLPIPRFDSANALHLALAAAAIRAEQIAVDVSLPDNVKFQNARALVRVALTEAKVSEEIDELVATLLGQPISKRRSAGPNERRPPAS